MNRLINTFKYGSWKTRLFFGAIALAFFGGAATIAVAAIAGLGIIPIAVGGAALVLGIGMSTMVTVVSDDDKEPGTAEGAGNPGNDDSDGNPGNGENSNEQETGANSRNPGSRENAGNPGSRENAGNTGNKSDSGTVRNESDPGKRKTQGKSESTVNNVNPAGNNKTEKADNSGRKPNPGVSGEPVQKEKNGVIYAEDDGRYVPDEIKEAAPQKASFVMKKVNNRSRLSPSDGPYIDGLPPEKTIGELSDEMSKENTSNNEVPGQSAEPKSRNAGTGGRSAGNEGNGKNGITNTGNDAAVPVSNAGNSAGRKRNTAAGNALTPALDGSSEDISDEGRKGIFKRFLSLFNRKDPEREAAKKAKEEAKKAGKKHLEDGRKSRRKRKDIKKQLKEKTKEYGEELEEKFENELSFADKEKQREDRYLNDLKGRKEADAQARKAAKEENAESENGENKTDAEENSTIFSKVGGFFKKLFGNVYDEPDEDNSSDAGKKNVKNSEELSETDSKDRKQKDKKRKDKKNKKSEGSDDDDRKNDKEAGSDLRSDDPRSKGRNPEEGPQEEENAPRKRLPGEDINVSKYTTSNLKKIIKAKKLGKDFIPVFIESWDSQQAQKTPALCYVKEDRVHFLLLEGDMERDASMPLTKFINVWYKKNVQETNLRAYKNIKENMGAYEMFEDVMPSFMTTDGQLGVTAFTQNLYLIGNDIAVAPPSMRELRKRFRFNTNIFASLNVRGEYSDYFKKAYENRILWTDNVIGIQEYQRRIRAILQEMVNDENLLKFEFKDEVDRMVQYRLITDEYAQFYMNLKEKG